MKVGQKVICVDDSIPPLEIFKHFDYWIEAKKTYIIRGTRQWYGETSLLLEGLKNSPMYNPEIMGKCEPGYNAKRFRLLEETPELEIQEIKTEKI